MFHVEVIRPEAFLYNALNTSFDNFNIIQGKKFADPPQMLHEMFYLHNRTGSDELQSIQHIQNSFVSISHEILVILNPTMIVHPDQQIRIHKYIFSILLKYIKSNNWLYNFSFIYLH